MCVCKSNTEWFRPGKSFVNHILCCYINVKHKKNTFPTEHLALVKYGAHPETPARWRPWSRHPPLSRHCPIGIELIAGAIISQLIFNDSPHRFTNSQHFLPTDTSSVRIRQGRGVQLYSDGVAGYQQLYYPTPWWAVKTEYDSKKKTANENGEISEGENKRFRCKAPILIYNRQRFERPTDRRSRGPNHIWYTVFGWCAPTFYLTYGVCFVPRAFKSPYCKSRSMIASLFRAHNVTGHSRNLQSVKPFDLTNNNSHCNAFNVE
jgi:hypothetical protein